MKQMRDFLQRHREVLSRSSQEATQALDDQRETFVTEVTSEVWRRDEQVHDLRAELSLHTLHNNKIKNMLDYIST